MSKEVLESRSVGFYIDKNVMWENDINTFIFAIREGGIYQKLLDNHRLYRKRRSAGLKKTAVPEKLGLVSPGLQRAFPNPERTPLPPNHFAVIVIVWVVGMFLAILALILEWFYAKSS